MPRPPRTPSPAEIQLDECVLPHHVDVTAARLHRDVRAALARLDVVAGYTSDPEVQARLVGSIEGWRRELAAHQPTPAGWCPRCRTSDGLSARWPCEFWRRSHAVLTDP